MMGRDLRSAAASEGSHILAMLVMRADRSIVTPPATIRITPRTVSGNAKY